MVRYLQNLINDRFGFTAIEYALIAALQLFGLLQNAFNTTYYTFGTFSPTSSVFLAQAPGATNPRSYSPGAPIAGTVGVRVTF
jgi:hypothetical protein